MTDSLAQSRNGASETPASSNLRRRQEALQEYYVVQDLVDRFDERSLKIKSWSVTSCGVALGFGLAENQPLLFCLAAFGSLVFWYLETLWKVYQRVLIERAAELEKLLAQEAIAYTGPKISERFLSSFRGPVRSELRLKLMQHKSVRVPHFFIFSIGVLLFLASLLKAKLQAVIGF